MCWLTTVKSKYIVTSKWLHGTPISFDGFDGTKIKEHGFGRGIYFTTSFNEAKIYAKKGKIVEIDPSNLNILHAEENPKIIQKIASNLGMPLLNNEKKAMYNLSSVPYDLVIYGGDIRH